MLRRNQEILRTFIVLVELFVISIAWVAAFLTRFHTIFPTPYVPSPLTHLQLLLFVLPLWFLLYRTAGLYDPLRTKSFSFECERVFRFSLLGLSILVGASFFTQLNLPRTVAVLFFFFVVLLTLSLRFSIRLVLSGIRRRGHNLRHFLLIGTGPQANRLIERVSTHKELGVNVIGLLSRERTSGHLSGIPIIGSYEDLPRILKENEVDDVILTLSASDPDETQRLLVYLQDETVNVQFVPDIPESLRLRNSIDDIEGLPIISVNDHPLFGWAKIQKRTLDLGISVLALLLLSPFLTLIALLVLIRSGRPILFSQERMGLDGKTFTMFKFRTMNHEAELETGPMWAKPNDPRRTKLGAFLRKTSLDELPQLWNILRGDMSVVGPRPERPVFIQTFRKELPGYMLRHKVKSGMTGWAQINGWRGNTSINERLHFDVYYIDNWSFTFDLRIIIMTIWRGIFNRNAY